MAVIEATRPAFWVQLEESTQQSAKPANSNWQLAISKANSSKFSLRPSASSAVNGFSGFAARKQAAHEAYPDQDQNQDKAQQ